MTKARTTMGARKLAARKRARPHRPLHGTWDPPGDRGEVLRVALVRPGKILLRPLFGPARDLYGGILFHACVAYAHATGHELRVASTEHGLLRLDDSVEPYDFPLESRTASRRRSWAQSIVSSLEAAFAGRALYVVLLMPNLPSDVLGAALNRRMIAWERPLDSMSIGERRAWLRSGAAFRTGGSRT